MLAKKNGYPNPVNDSYQETGKMYNKVVQYLYHRSFDSSSRPMYIVIATHNEDAVTAAVDMMQRSKGQSTSSSFVFGQIYGMAEQISMPLG